MPGTLEQRDFPGAGDPARLLPPASADLAPFLDGLRERRLMLQRCRGCRRLRHPIAPVCPYCRGTEFGWESLAGRGTVHSWIRYRRSYLPEFEPLMPYVVLSVTLAEGPRMFGRLRDADGDPSVEPHIGMAVRAIVERCPDGRCIAAFVADGVGESAAP
jgi:uncharacterized protein